MSEQPLVIDVVAHSPEQIASLRRLSLAVYVLYALSWLFAVTGLIGIIVNYVKRDDARGTLYESHFNWQITTFWWSLGGALLGLATLVVGVGFVVLLGTAVWSIYRLVKGWLYWNDRKPLPL